MFQLVCDPSGVVVETTLKELVPAVLNWGNKLDHISRVLLSHILSSARVCFFLLLLSVVSNIYSLHFIICFSCTSLIIQRCPPLSGVEGSVESHLRVLGERERWNIDVLLRLLIELLPYVYQKAVETCPFSSDPETAGTTFSTSLLELYTGYLSLPFYLLFMNTFLVPVIT